MFVVSNRQRIKGAAAILNRDALRGIGERYHTDRLVVIPSSVHECLVIPYTEEIDLDEISVMVQAVNAEEVASEEQLGDRAYIINL